MINTRTMGPVLAIFTLLAFSAPAYSQSDAHEDLTPCAGSAPEPAQSAAWSVAFCNRTGHDVVIEFHDNDCPARDWSRRGDVYQRTLRRGESKTLPLCYANEPAGKKLAPGTPALRIPGGRGVVTTWSVVGDCGERSKPLSIDARTFYDRGEYKTGIVLLQYPSGASHCVADGASGSGAASAAAAGASGAAASSGAGGATHGAGVAAGVGAGANAAAAGAGSASGSAAAGTGSAAGNVAAASSPQATTYPAAAGQASGAAAAPGSSAAAPAGALAPPAHPRGNEAPTLRAVINTKDIIGRSVHVFAAGGAGYKCNFNLGLTFTDGAGWNDHVKVDIAAGDGDAPIVTRKYLKTVTKVEITSNKCEPL